MQLNVLILFYSRAKPCSYNQRLNNNNNKIRTFSRIDSTQLTGLCRVYTATLYLEVASPWLVQCLYLFLIILLFSWILKICHRILKMSIQVVCTWNNAFYMTKVLSPHSHNYPSWVLQLLDPMIKLWFPPHQFHCQYILFCVLSLWVLSPLVLKLVLNNTTVYGFVKISEYHPN